MPHRAGPTLPGTIMSIMRRTLLVCAGLVTMAGGLHAQARTGAIDPAKLTVIRRILDVTRAADQMFVAMEASLPMQRMSNPQIPAVFWDRFMTRAREQRGALVDSLVPIYDRNFSLADLSDLLRFYESPVGKRFIDAMPR
jgi:hypothetical protein